MASVELTVSKAGEEVILCMEVVGVDDEDLLNGIVCVGNETTVCFISRHINMISREVIQLITCGLPVQSLPTIDGC